MTKVKSKKILNQKENRNITDIRKILNNKKFKKRKYKKNYISKKKEYKTNKYLGNSEPKR